MCATPGCSLKDFHLGPCLPFARLKRCERARGAPANLAPCLERPSRSPTPAPSYDGTVKAAQRSVLERLAKGRADDRSILYLDDERGSCTRELLDRGLAPSRLAPVNFKPIDLRGVTGRVVQHQGDIFALACAASPGQYLCAWYDTVNQHLPVDLRTFAHASPYIMICLSTRKQSPRLVQRSLEMQCNRLKDVRLLWSMTYIGVGEDHGSKKTNMVCVLLQHDPWQVPVVSAPSMSLLEDWQNVPLLVPLARWRRARVAFDATRYNIVNDCIVATVSDVDRLGEPILVYQRADGRMEPDMRTTEKRVALTSGPITVELMRQWMLGASA